MNLYRATMVLAVILSHTLPVEGHTERGVKPRRTQMRLTSQKLAERHRDLAVVDRDYKLGEKLRIELKKNESARLRCADNPYGLQEILLGWISNDVSLGISGDLMDVRFVSDQGKIGGGGSFLPRSTGFLRQFRSTPCLAVGRYDLVDGKIAMQFRLQTDPAENRRAYEEYLKIGGMALHQRGNWNVLTDTDQMPVPTLTASERVATFARLWSEVKYNFAFFDQVPDLDWDSVLEEYLPRVMEERSFHEYYLLLQRCIARLNDGHTEVWARVPTIMTDSPPLLIRPVEGKALVADIGTSREIQAAELTRGDEITHVDGLSVQEKLEQDIFPYVSSSTQQARDLEAYAKLLDGPKNSPVNIRIRGSDNAPRELELIRRSKWEDKPWTQLSSFEFRDIPQGIAYVAIRSFGSGDVVEQFDEIFHKVQNARGLIIDVRENGGGDTRYASAIVGYLTDRTLIGSRWKTRQYMPSFRAWNQEEKWHEGAHEPVEPGTRNPFLGPLAVLIGPGTVSAAEDFLVTLHYSGRATLVGENTAGTTGQPLIVPLTAGMARICTKRDTYPDGREFVGIGVIPDVEVVPTREDVSSGRDAVLEKAMDVIKTSAASWTAPGASER
ncbi:MAG: S41 family peptidase [Gemmatimonadetes bacterium]|nr:S41 family peptidase [Gemmatimonadota bacterium]MDE3259626.1 S41 family peptidase [Gemmatimonadota bacterium]